MERRRVVVVDETVEQESNMLFSGLEQDDVPLSPSLGESESGSEGVGESERLAHESHT